MLLRLFDYETTSSPIVVNPRFWRTLREIPCREIYMRSVTWDGHLEDDDLHFSTESKHFTLEKTKSNNCQTWWWSILCAKAIDVHMSSDKPAEKCGVALCRSCERKNLDTGAHARTRSLVSRTSKAKRLQLEVCDYKSSEQSERSTILLLTHPSD